MKCHACNFESIGGWDAETLTYIKEEGEQFIRSKSPIYFENKHESFRVDEHTVYACPRCGTLKIDI